MNFTYRSHRLSKDWNRFFILLLLLLSVFSCSLFSGAVRESTEPEKEIVTRIKSEGFLVKKVIINKSFDSELVRENCVYALSILIPDRAAHDADSLTAYIVLKEEAFIKGFRQLNSVSLEIVIRGAYERIVKKVLVSEETENTLSSYRYLYKILEKGVKEAGL